MALGKNLNNNNRLKMAVSVLISFHEPFISTMMYEIITPEQTKHPHYTTMNVAASNTF